MGVRGTLGIFAGWECAAETMEPSAYTRASSGEFYYPVTKLRKFCYPRVAFRLSCVKLNLPVWSFFLDPNSLIYIPHPGVNCLKTIPFTAAHTYILNCPLRKNELANYLLSPYMGIFTFRPLATNNYELIRSCKNNAVRLKEQSLISSQNSLQNTSETIILVSFGC